MGGRFPSWMGGWLGVGLRCNNNHFGIFSSIGQGLLFYGLFRVVDWVVLYD
jgi:hypothetical protein